jgi:hypothetical protein
MLTSEIITKFELQVDDSTELSSSEELDLANKVYQQVCSYRPWEFLKATCSTAIAGSGTTIALPSDFAYMASNQTTDSNVSDETITAPKGVYVGANLTFVRMINYSDRRQYSNQNVCYIDPTDSKIHFITTQTETTQSFDYIKFPATLTLATSPVFPARFHDVIVYGMAADDYVIQQSDLTKGLMQANQKRYKEMLDDMSYWHAQSFLN